MIVGLSHFQEDMMSTFNTTTVQKLKTTKIEISKIVLDEVYIEGDTAVGYNREKPDSFLVTTLLNAKFKGNLEGGNLQLDGIGIENIGVQKRKVGHTEWIDVGNLTYHRLSKTYSALDKNIELDQEYEYCIFPKSKGLIGIRRISDPIKTKFDGVFLSDKDNNFHFLSNFETSDISHIRPSKIHESMYSKYPIVSYSSADYSTFNFTGWYVSKDVLDEGVMKIGHEKNRQDVLMKWLKNGKPKVFRDNNGILKLVSVVNTITQSQNGLSGGLLTTISLVEIGDITDNNTLKESGVI